MSHKCATPPSSTTSPDAFSHCLYFLLLLQLNHMYVTIQWLTPVIDMLCNDIVDFTEVEILASPISVSILAEICI